ncbi:hypothetical protein ACYOEI_02525 [Singulisphaera rosea]
MFRFTPSWEHPDTKATLLAMQAKLEEAQGESARHDGDRAVFLSALSEVVALGAACLARYPERGEVIGSPDKQELVDILTMLWTDPKHEKIDPDAGADQVA